MLLQSTVIVHPNIGRIWSPPNCNAQGLPEAPTPEISERDSSDVNQVGFADAVATRFIMHEHEVAPSPRTVCRPG
jgi:hypothetical protein